MKLTNLFTGGNFEQTNENVYKTSGTFKSDDKRKVTEIQGSIYKSDTYIGNFNAYMEGDSLKYNISSLAVEDLVAVSTMVSTCGTEIEASLVSAFSLKK